MTEFGEGLIPDAPRPTRLGKFRPAALLLTPLAAILFQVYVPLFFQYLSYLEMPLLVTVYFALMRRGPVSGLFLGAGIGLVQDSLSGQPLGMFGIVKTLVGYFAASVSLRFDVDNPLIRLVLAFFFFFFHQFFYWVLASALLGQQMRFDLQQTAISGLLNAAVALPMFHVLDKLRERG
ncbi:MAG: rod shape-determining protein MreD [Acidobacteria bacterium]|jgi:rod shape-determining protein MreD|nr:rod shape-determining protein MreD [Acidobacteriota bacterium]